MDLGVPVKRGLCWQSQYAKVMAFPLVQANLACSEENSKGKVSRVRWRW